MNVELQEKWRTSEDKLKTLEEFAAKYGLQRTDTPYPPGFP
jgi:hypothetical protein